MAAMLILFNENAEKYRNALKEWISQAEQWQDFTVDVKSNWRYLDRSIKPHVLPLLKSLGLSVKGQKHDSDRLNIIKRVEVTEMMERIERCEEGVVDSRDQLEVITKTNTYFFHSETVRQSSLEH
ncbi:predicted protein [Histoplasma capsulatum H143]|uniref:Uncharacterized protein n=1 Tax=Ajellomyces capsulatus (strain H143) TaxID=544712 RepID=C6HFN4_AJECH|nr:predicted protein [Histoplasma capsulatum H143]